MQVRRKIVSLGDSARRAINHNDKVCGQCLEEFARIGGQIYRWPLFIYFFTEDSHITLFAEDISDLQSFFIKIARRCSRPPNQYSKWCSRNLELQIPVLAKKNTLVIICVHENSSSRPDAVPGLPSMGSFGLQHLHSRYFSSFRPTGLPAKIERYSLGSTLLGVSGYLHCFRCDFVGPPGPALARLS